MSLQGSYKKLRLEDIWQIKLLRFNQKCVGCNLNSKVTAEVLADKYLEVWRNEFEKV